MDSQEHGQLVFQERIIDSDISAKDAGLRKVFKTAIVFSWFGQNAHCTALKNRDCRIRLNVEKVRKEENKSTQGLRASLVFKGSSL